MGRSLGPIARLRRRALVGLSPWLDRVFVRLAFRPPPKRRGAPRGSPSALLEEAGSYYLEAGRQGLLFPAPTPAALDVRSLAELPEGRLLALSWPSGYRPLHPVYQETLAKAPANDTCRARWYAHREPRAAVICLHGWGMGHAGVEAGAFRARWLYDHGLDVVLHVMPFHAGRRAPGRLAPMYPSVNPVRTTEAFAQAVYEIRALAAGLRVRGVPRVGVAGLSLGGYTTALCATADPDLDFAVPMLPFASVGAMMWEVAGEDVSARKAADAGVTKAQFMAAFGALDVLERAPAMDPTQILLMGGEQDRVTPLRYAQSLHHHFPGSRLLTFPGAHLLQVGRGRMFHGMLEFLGVPE